tara:strand:+ start:245 stop:1681 length:1437 start_codon:yes stop_codon:yes gene_type:complete
MNQFMSGIVPLVDEARRQYVNLEEPKPLLEPLTPEMPQDPPVVPPTTLFNIKMQEMTDALKNKAQTPSVEVEEKDNFLKDYTKYKDRMSEVLQYSPKPSIFDAATDIGAALLADTRQNPYVGLGKGFLTFNERVRKKDEERRQIDQRVGLEAIKLATEDERLADKYLNDYNLKILEKRLESPALVEYEVDEIDPSTQKPTGNKVILKIDKNNTAEVMAIQADPSARLIEPAKSQITIEAEKDEPKADKEARGSLSKIEDDLAEAKQRGRSQKDLIDRFLVEVNRLSDDDFGNVEAATLQVRKVMDELGIKYDTKGVIGSQELLGSLGTRLAMGLIQNTKGAITEMEMRLFLSASPTLASTKEGLLELADYLGRIANRDINRSVDYNRALAKENLHDRVLDDGTIEPLTDRQRLNATNSYLDEWYKANPFLTEKEREELADLAKKYPERLPGYQAEIERANFFDDYQGRTTGSGFSFND